MGWIFLTGPSISASGGDSQIQDAFVSVAVASRL